MSVAPRLTNRYVDVDAVSTTGGGVNTIVSTGTAKAATGGAAPIVVLPGALVRPESWTRPIVSRVSRTLPDTAAPLSGAIGLTTADGAENSRGITTSTRAVSTIARTSRFSI